MLRSHLGTEVLHQFVEHTEEYHGAASLTQDELKSGSFERFMEYIYC